MTTKELDKEAGNYADKHAFRVPYDGSNKFYDDIDFKASEEGYLAGAKPREKKISELEQENTDLRKRNAELKGMYANSAREAGTYKQFLELKEKENSELKELIKNIIRVTWGEGWSYSLDWKVKAEQFLNSELQSKWINPARTTNDNEIKLNSEVEK